VRAPRWGRSLTETTNRALRTDRRNRCFENGLNIDLRVHAGSGAPTSTSGARHSVRRRGSAEQNLWRGRERGDRNLKKISLAIAKDAAHTEERTTIFWHDDLGACAGYSAFLGGKGHRSIPLLDRRCGPGR